MVFYYGADTVMLLSPVYQVVKLAFLSVGSTWGATPLAIAIVVVVRLPSC
jgi:hypothetical protein